MATFLTLALIRAKWLGAIPYIAFTVLFLPIVVMLNIPYYAAVNHEMINLAHVWGLFPYVILSAIVILFVVWSPLFVILRKRRQSLVGMALAVCGFSVVVPPRA